MESDSASSSSWCDLLPIEGINGGDLFINYWFGPGWGMLGA